MKMPRLPFSGKRGQHRVKDMSSIAIRPTVPSRGAPLPKRTPGRPPAPTTTRSPSSPVNPAARRATGASLETARRRREFDRITDAELARPRPRSAGPVGSQGVVRPTRTVETPRRVGGQHRRAAPPRPTVDPEEGRYGPATRTPIVPSGQARGVANRSQAFGHKLDKPPRHVEEGPRGGPGWDHWFFQQTNRMRRPRS